MEFINFIERQKMSLVVKLRQQLLFTGAGPDNSVYIDKLSSQIQELEDNIDIFYHLYTIPRIKVLVTPYAYLHKLSPPSDIIPFTKKLDIPCKNPIGFFDENANLVAIGQNIK
jgi:hypothetical protein